MTYFKVIILSDGVLNHFVYLYGEDAVRKFNDRKLLDDLVMLIRIGRENETKEEVLKIYVNPNLMR